MNREQTLTNKRETAKPGTSRGPRRPGGRKFFGPPAILPALLFLAALSLFAEGEDSAVPSAAAAIGEDWEADPELIMEGEGVTLVEERTPANPAVPESGLYGDRRNIVTDDQIREQGSLDILDALRNVPGVMFSKKNGIGANTGTSLYVRGRGYTHPSLDTTISFDGVPRYGFIYGQTMADGIPVFAADSVEIFKSPQPSNFGTGYAAVNVIPKYQDEQGWSAEAGFSGGSFFTLGENTAAGWRRGPFDIYAAQSWVSTEGHVVHSASYQQSYYLNTGFWLNAYWNLRLLGNFVDAETQEPPRTGQSKDDILSTFKTDTVFTTAAVNNEYNNAKGFIKLYYTYTDFKWIDEDRRNPGGWSRQVLNAWGLRAKEVFSFWRGGDITGGVDLDMNKTANEDHNTITPSVFTDFPLSTLFSPYAAVSQFLSLGRDFYLIPSAGIRGLIHSIWDNSLSPQAGLAAGWNNLELSFSYARGVIYPAPADIQGLVDNGGLGNADLKKAKPETVHHYEGGLSWKQPAVVSLSASYFYDDGRDRIIAAGPAVPGNVSTASYFRIQGLDLGGSLTINTDRLMLKRIESFAGLNWITGIQARGEDGKELNRLPYTPRFSLSAGFKWSFLKNFHLGGGYQFLHDLYSGNLGQSASFTGLSESQRLDDIHLLNLRLGYSFTHRPWRIEEGEIFISAANLLNRRYQYYQGFDMPGFTFTAGGSLNFK
jgi:iron complex outermembrane receptor protein